MHVGITTFGTDGGQSGIGQYLMHLLHEFARSPSEARYDVVTYPEEQNLFVPEVSALTAYPVSSALRHPVWDIAWHQWVLPRLCRRRQYDVLFLPAANRRVPLYAPCPTVGTVHDLSALHVQDKYDTARMWYITRVLPTLIRRLTYVITVSESSKRDIVHYAKVPAERVWVIPLAADPHVYFPRNPARACGSVHERYRLQNPYMLYVARIEHPGKNHVRLIEAFSRWKTTKRRPHQLVLAGSDWTQAEAVHQAIRNSGCAHDIVCTGFVPPEDLPHLYCGAELFLFPSLYEGFGLPILEAMSCGVPVACSNSSSMPEVAGDAAHFFDPYDIDAMLDAMERCTTDTAYRASCIQRGLAQSRIFTWARTAARTFDVLRLAMVTAK